MPPATNTTGLSRRPVALLDWLAPHLRWIILPSWLLSLVLHAIFAMLVLMLSQLPSCQGDFGGEGGEDFRSVGIRQRSASPQPTPGEIDVPPTEMQVIETLPNVAPVFVPNEPPVPLTLPEMPAPVRPVLGAGAPLEIDASQFSNVIKPAPASTPVAAGGGAEGTAQRATSFLGVADKGRSFVYIIDRSSSMEDDGRLRAAKTELLSSLQQLDESQQFQIIFYNAQFTILQPRQDRFDMFFGTDAQRLQVVEQLREVTPSGGTLHFPAIMRGLKFRPDVMFLLTDGDPASALTRSELEDIRMRNGGSTHIHCIEFGQGPRSANGDAASGNFLHKLAKENQGQYIYRNALELR